MKKSESFTSSCRALQSQDGQVLVWMALLMVSLLGLAALVVDLGHAFFCYRELQGSSNASALAGAVSLPATTAIAAATVYSSAPGGKNVYSNLPGVTMAPGYPQLVCLATVTSEGTPCAAPSNANAIIVRQQATVPMLFAMVLGHNTLAIATTATAAMKGAINLAIILDTTASMNSTDSASNCNNTRLSCALAGIQTLLGTLPASVDTVSLFTFPNVTTATASNDYNCGGGAPAIDPYTFPSAAATTYAPTTDTYQIVSFSSNYKGSSSNLVSAIGGKSGCAGVQAPGGEGTYYAGAIYGAQAALLAEQAANPGSQNVLVMLSDGDANAISAHMPGASTTSGVYPSTANQCQQAVAAAQAAAAAGTSVYSVAYGAKATGCSTDSGITPCQTMEGIASSPSNFFSDYTATGGSSTCISASSPASDLQSIFTKIGKNLSITRLIPNGTP